MNALCLLPLMVGTAALAAEIDVTQTNKPRPALEITAGFAEFRLKENTAYYSNDVVVTDPPSKPGDAPTIIHCRELTAVRGAAGKLDTIVAQHDVQIDQGDNHARGQLAVYTATNEWLVLTGGFPPYPLPILYSSQGTNAGTVIVYDRLHDKLFITNATTVIPGATISKANQRGTNSPILNDKLTPRKAPPATPFK